jgi:hypothetical protein
MRAGYGLDGVFLALGLALLVFPAVTGGAILLGSWFPGERVPRAAAA